MNKIDRETLHALADIMAEDNTDRLEYLYYSFEGQGWPLEMQKKKITITIEDIDDNQ